MGTPLDALKLKGDVNKFVDQIRSGVGDISQQLKVNKSLILNNTSEPVNFYVYNYVDNAYWISAMHSLAAPNKAVAVAASGVAFKIHPNDNKQQEFLVDPGRAYIYNGPGDITPV
jgi:hypothetical protein